jgi:uncharacterized membrane protein YGL010W
MSLSHFIFRDVPVDAWVDRYEKSHQNPINRVFHTFGIPMIAVSIPLFLIAPLVRGFWKIPLSLFTAGWICQVLGHLIEGKPPEFLKDWRFLLERGHALTSTSPPLHLGVRPLCFGRGYPPAKSSRLLSP